MGSRERASIWLKYATGLGPLCGGDEQAVEDAGQIQQDGAKTDSYESDLNLQCAHELCSEPAFQRQLWQNLSGTSDAAPGPGCSLASLLHAVLERHLWPAVCSECHERHIA